MRSSIYTFLLAISLFAFSEDFTVFEKDGYFGIKDETGQVTVPPVYERLGWSSGGNEVFDGLIGYKRGNFWGLISVRNKALTEQKYYSLEPFKKGFVKAAIKGKFSNHLFYGLLDAKGKTVVSFNYFALSQFDNALLVSEFNAGKQFFGLVSMDNEILISLSYKGIYRENNFLFGETFSHTLDVFYENRLVQPALDSIQFHSGLVGYRAGYAGFINDKGELVHDFQFKSIGFEEGEAKAIKFPTWKVYSGQRLELEWQCDSITRTKNKIWIANLNRAQHIVLPETVEFNSKEYVIKKIENDFTIVQHSKSRKFSVINTSGKILTSGYDSIAFSQTHFLGFKKGKWDILNSSGKKLHKMSYDQILVGPRNFFISSRNDHWGVIDFNGDEYFTFKYDSIIYTQNHYQVKYFGKWGILDFHGNWLVQPEYAEVQSFENVVIARKGLGYSVFHNNEFKFKTTHKPLHTLGENIVIAGDSNRLGVINEYGSLIAEPIYDEVLAWGDFIELKLEGYSTLISNTGKLIFQESDMIQEVGGVSETYFSVRKNNKWGFVDETGILRISNRYDSIQSFSEGMSAVELRNKWGFINKEESLVIQPYYDQVSAFEDGLAIVIANGLSGIINKKGEPIVELSFHEIKRLSTGFLVKDTAGKFGLINSEGMFLIRPAYQYLRDSNEGIIVMQNDKWGLLDYNGNQLFKLAYGFVQVVEKFIVVKM